MKKYLAILTICFLTGNVISQTKVGTINPRLDGAVRMIDTVSDAKKSVRKVCSESSSVYIEQSGIGKEEKKKINKNIQFEYENDIAIVKQYAMYPRGDFHTPFNSNKIVSVKFKEGMFYDDLILTYDNGGTKTIELKDKQNERFSNISYEIKEGTRYTNNGEEAFVIFKKDGIVMTSIWQDDEYIVLVF